MKLIKNIFIIKKYLIKVYLIKILNLRGKISKINLFNLHQNIQFEAD